MHCPGGSIVNDQHGCQFNYIHEDNYYLMMRVDEKFKTNSSFRMVEINNGYL